MLCWLCLVFLIPFRAQFSLVFLLTHLRFLPVLRSRFAPRWLRTLDQLFDFWCEFLTPTTPRRLVLANCNGKKKALDF